MMKELLNEALTKKLSTTLEAVGGAKALFGEAINLDGESIVPVGKISITLKAEAAGSGAGNAGGLSGGLASLSKGGGGGNADASIQIQIEPVGFVCKGKAGAEFRHIE